MTDDTSYPYDRYYSTTHTQLIISDTSIWCPLLNVRLVSINDEIEFDNFVNDIGRASIRTIHRPTFFYKNEFYTVETVRSNTMRGLIEHLRKDVAEKKIIHLLHYAIDQNEKYVIRYKAT